MRPPKQKQPQVKKGLCRVLEHVDVDEKSVHQLIPSSVLSQFNGKSRFPDKMRYYIPHK